MMHHMQVVGDDHHRQAQALAQVVEQVQHLALDRDIEPAVGSSAMISAGIERNRPRHADPPGLPARKLMRDSGSRNLPGRPTRRQKSPRSSRRLRPIGDARECETAR